jgi:hypothetical protein
MLKYHYEIENFMIDLIEIILDEVLMQDIIKVDLLDMFIIQIIWMFNFYFTKTLNYKSFLFFINKYDSIIIIIYKKLLCL